VRRGVRGCHQKQSGRDCRTAFDEVWHPYIAATARSSIGLGGNEIAEYRFDFSDPIPARDVLHVRLHTPQHPLKGVSPILATVLERAMAGAALNQQVTFYINQARPSFMLETDAAVTKEQTEACANGGMSRRTGENAGGTPILAWGLKAKPVSVSPADSRLPTCSRSRIRALRLHSECRSRCLGVGDTPFASTGALMSAWKSSGLGFALNHIEEAIGNLFGLKGQPDEYLEFNTDALMRSNFKERMEGWAIATSAGLAINEFRNAEGYASVKDGDEPRVQQQQVPLSYGADMKPPDPNRARAARAH
jgi:phage portal protein BeeE